MTSVPPASALSIDEQHVAILQCCDDLLAALRTAAGVGELGQIRMRLAGLLHANLAAEEVQLNGPLRRLPAELRPRSFTEVSAEAVLLRSRYSEHVGHWSLTAIGANRPDYARAAAQLVREVRTHLAKKRAALPDWRRALG